LYSRTLFLTGARVTLAFGIGKLYTYSQDGSEYKKRLLILQIFYTT
jgi:hypothetical protein